MTAAVGVLVASDAITGAEQDQSSAMIEVSWDRAQMCLEVHLMRRAAEFEDR
jgi:hypothetical protein